MLLKVQYHKPVWKIKTQWPDLPAPKLVYRLEFRLSHSLTLSLSLCSQNNLHKPRRSSNQNHLSLSLSLSLKAQ